MGANKWLFKKGVDMAFKKAVKNAKSSGLDSMFEELLVLKSITSVYEELMDITEQEIRDSGFSPNEYESVVKEAMEKSMKKNNVRIRDVNQYE